jgi:GNAT superfamily N-acetyltransferase
MDLEFELTFEPSGEDNSRLGQGLNQHAIEQLGEGGFKPVGIFVRDGNGGILAGISGFLNWNWLQISLLWVDDSLRGEGVGSELMQRIESVGRDKGCRFAHVDTFSFQARAFYESLGFTVFATLESYPPEHSRHYLRKTL